MPDFRKLSVWNKSHQLTIEVYKATGVFPKEELYGLTAQIRRASVSVVSNIVEGCGRDKPLDFARFLQIAMGSLYELEYQLLLSRELKYIDEQTYLKLDSAISDIRKMLRSFINKLKLNSQQVKLKDSDNL